MPDTLPHSIIHGLPVMKFRGLDAPPYDAAGFDFGHRQTAREFYGVDGEAHQHGGFKAQTFPFRLYFLNTLQPNLFPTHWEKWWKALSDGTPGEMLHPAAGKQQVVVMGGDVALEARSTAGIVVNVQFRTTLLDPEEVQEFEALTINVGDAAAAAEAAAESAGVELPSEEAVTDLLDSAALLDGFLSQADMALNGIADDMLDVINDFASAAENLADHGTIEAWDAFTTLFGAVEDIKDKAGRSARPTAIILTTAETTLTKFAADVDNTVGEVMGLNPSALAFPTVPKGTMLRYYR